jgi:hypothetical protein
MFFINWKRQPESNYFFFFFCQFWAVRGCGGVVFLCKSIVLLNKSFSLCKPWFSNSLVLFDQSTVLLPRSCGGARPSHGRGGGAPTPGGPRAVHSHALAWCHRRRMAMAKDYPWIIHGISTDNPWFGLSREYPWIIHGLSMACPWTIHGCSLDNPWIIHGLSTDSPAGVGPRVHFIFCRVSLANHFFSLQHFLNQ